MTVTEYDRRQYQRMRSKIAAYQRGDIFLKTLLEDLRGLLDALKEADANWKQELLYKWGDLEVTFAVAGDRAEQRGLSEVHLNEEERNFVAEAVCSLDQMLVEKAG